VFCPKCQIGGEFVENINSQPQHWTCPECGTRYELPPTFYSEHVPLQFARTNELTDEFSIDLRFLHGEKYELLLTGGFLLFLLALPCLLLYPRNAWPLLLVLVANLAWSLVVGIGHRPISWDEFNALTDLEKRRRAYYDSAWAHLYGGGLALFIAAVFAWATLLTVQFTPPKDRIGLILGVLLFGGISLLLVYVGVKSLAISSIQFRKWRGSD